MPRVISASPQTAPGSFEKLGNVVYAVLFGLVVLSGAYFSFIHCNKPAIMYQNYLDRTSYKIFPYSEPKDQQTSKSFPLWLLVHVFDAYFHVILTGLVYFTQRSGDDQTLFTLSHYFFVVLIAINIWHAGNEPWQKAVVFNGVPTLTAVLTFDPQNKVWWKSLIYLVAVSSAILFETGMYLTHILA